ncbi:hypothetical protein PF001_g27558 [Phytophthora fragariae]|uniref:Clathrin/coatomer adaptor adaptin-like N-terminal domain-containing protein n=1 Tax=Phytophthora fragariae TaxID=53985 RepID=A0A6A4BDT4_9STRA|nr:hypothetical protein PF003_g19309 [Phytophthora fragariae]KAE9273323.1 hypothetical protein PF001_g27558 [Phytophthora fragariae]
MYEGRAPPPSRSPSPCYRSCSRRSTSATSGGQVFLLDALAGYTPSVSREAEGIIERVTNDPPLVTLVSAEPEIQYVALRNINLIVQKRPAILANEIKVFFSKYNDPIYVKMDKLEIIIRLVSETNIEQVLLEFKE